MKVLIMGRTNVGKSSLFNRISKSHQALVFNEPKITRDLLKSQAHWWGESFEIRDSGGLPLSSEKDELSLKIKSKIFESFKESHLFVMVAEGSSGIHPEDLKLCQKIRKTGKPWLLVINKVDDFSKSTYLMADFFKLHPHPIPISCEKNYGIDQIIDWILLQKKNLSPSSKPSSQKNSSITKLFVIGKANSGKSSLCNRILNKDRMIVCSQAGTTLDTVTELFSKNNQSYSLSDNPGFRRGNREERERLSFSKSRSEIKGSHIVLLVMDGTQNPSRQEAKLIQLCLEKNKPLILVVNKMDCLPDKEERDQLKEKIKKTFCFVPDLPSVFVSAKTGYNKEKLFYKIEEVEKKMHFKISTPQLNDFFIKTIRKSPLPVYGTRNVKFYYVTQTHKTPPSFLAFANYPKGVSPTYRRFIINQMKKNWNLKGIPISFHILQRK